MKRTRNHHAPEAEHRRVELRLFILTITLLILCGCAKNRPAAKTPAETTEEAPVENSPPSTKSSQADPTAESESESESEPVPESVVATHSAGEIWIEHYFADDVQKCAIGDSSSCRRLVARTHFSTNDKESDRYYAVFEAACENGVASACGAHGRDLTSRGDAEGGRAFLERGCAEDDGYSCAILAEQTINGKDASADAVAKAEKQLDRHCKSLGGWPCMTYALALIKKGDNRKAEAYRLMARACETGDPIACYEYGRMLGDTRDKTPKEQARVTGMYQKACDADFAYPCYNLAWRYFDGKGVDKDEKTGWGLVVKACHLGDAKACDHLAQLETRESPDTEEAEEIFIRYCALWGANACYNVAAHLVKRRGETAETAKGLVELARRACNRGDAAGCNVLGHVAKDYIGMCDRGEKVKDACAFAGYIYAVGIWLPKLSGQSIAPDVKKAVEYLSRSCEAGSEAACGERDRLEKSDTP